MSRPVFSFRPNLKNSEHEKAWRILQEAVRAVPDVPVEDKSINKI